MGSNSTRKKGWRWTRGIRRGITWTCRKAKAGDFRMNLGTSQGTWADAANSGWEKALFQCWETLKDPLRLGFAGDFLFSNWSIGKRESFFLEHVFGGGSQHVKTYSAIFRFRFTSINSSYLTSSSRFHGVWPIPAIAGMQFVRFVCSLCARQRSSGSSAWYDLLPSKRSAEAAASVRKGWAGWKSLAADGGRGHAGTHWVVGHDGCLASKVGSAKSWSTGSSVGQRLVLKFVPKELRSFEEMQSIWDKHDICQVLNNCILNEDRMKKPTTWHFNGPWS